MEFRISKEASQPGAVTLTIFADFTPEEAAALTHFKAWEQRCTNEFSAPSFRRLIHPGIKIENCVPIYADYFQSRFDGTHGKLIRYSLSPILDAFRREMHEETEAERDEHFGIKRLPVYRRYLPES